MKNKGFTLVETMLVVLISVFMFGVLLSLFFMGQKTFVTGSTMVELQQKARFAMDRIAGELILSTPAQVEIKKDSSSDYAEGDVIALKTPQVTSDPVKDTMYNSNSTIKWGAEGDTAKSIRYLVPSNTNFWDGNAGYRGKLIKLVDKTIVLPPTTTLPGRGRGICFLAGTTILMADGKTLAIENIKVGDEVLGFDTKLKTTLKDKVSRVINDKATEYFLINGKIKVTLHHPFYVRGRWIEAGKLKIGDKLLSFKGEEIPVLSIRKIKLNSGVKIYNLEVKKHHTFYAEGILVHNKIIIRPTEPPRTERPGRSIQRKIFNFKAFVKSFFSNIAFADVILKSPPSNYYSITVIADNITKINFDGCNQAGDCNDLYTVSPNAVKITITASKKTLLGQQITFTLTSLVTLKN